MIVSLPAISFILFLFACSISICTSFRSVVKPISPSATLLHQTLLPLDHARAEHLRINLLSLCDELKTKTLKSSKPKEMTAEDRDKFRYLENRIIALIQKLAIENPTENPLKGWIQSNKYNPPCLLEGSWKLRFTTAEDAKPRPRQNSTATTFQYVNGTSGLITNIIAIKDSAKNTSTTLRVEVQGEQLSPNSLLLLFLTVTVIQSNNRPDGKLKTTKFPFPRLPFSNILFRRLNLSQQRRAKPIGPAFTIIYLDDDLRIHKTARGDYFVQSRLYDVWDPMKGWAQVSAV